MLIHLELKDSNGVCQESKAGALPRQTSGQLDSIVAHDQAKSPMLLTISSSLSAIITLWSMRSLESKPALLMQADGRISRIAWTRSP